MVKPEQASAIAASASGAAAAAMTALKLLDIFNESTDRLNRTHRQRLVLPIPSIQFNLDTLCENACYEYTRFSNTDIRRLANIFHLETIIYPSRITVLPTTALCVVLYRLSRPRGYTDLIPIFGRSRTWLSQVFNVVIEYLARKYRPMLQWDEGRLNRRQLKRYAQAVESVGGPGLIWGFIEGTFRPSNRPMVDQRQFYSGHKKSHGLKYQGIVTPDGLISGLQGPVIGKTGDWKMWIDFGISNRLRSLFQDLPLSQRLLLYGDKAYVMGGFGITGAFSSTSIQPLSLEKERFNRVMTRFRISVEHGFGKVSNEWQHLGFTRGSSLGLSPVGGIYHVAVLLTNCHSCLYGNQTAKYFAIEPALLEDYLGHIG